MTPERTLQRRAAIAGYSGTPLAKKLGIESGMRVRAVGAPTTYPRIVAALPEGVILQSRLTSRTQLVHHFTRSRAELALALRRYRDRLADDAVVWVSWPKKSSGVPSTVTEDTVREIALPLGFVDVKVCAVDEVWSGLKLVVRSELRR
jgi:hypothetical protein